MITLRHGRWGPYVRHGKTMATLPKDMKEKTPTLEQAVEWIDAKSAKGGGKKKAATKKKAGAKKKAAVKNADTTGDDS